MMHLGFIPGYKTVEKDIRPSSPEPFEHYQINSVVTMGIRRRNTCGVAHEHLGVHEALVCPEPLEIFRAVAISSKTIMRSSTRQSDNIKDSIDNRRKVKRVIKTRHQGYQDKEARNAAS